MAERGVTLGIGLVPPLALCAPRGPRGPRGAHRESARRVECAGARGACSLTMSPSGLADLRRRPVPAQRRRLAGAQHAPPARTAPIDTVGRRIRHPSPRGAFPGDSATLRLWGRGGSRSTGLDFPGRHRRARGGPGPGGGGAVVWTAELDKQSSVPRFSRLFPASLSFPPACAIGQVW